MHHDCLDKYCIHFAGFAIICDAGTIKLADISLSGMINPQNYSGSRWSEKRGGVGLVNLVCGVVPMSDVSFNK